MAELLNDFLRPTVGERLEHHDRPMVWTGTVLAIAGEDDQTTRVTENGYICHDPECRVTVRITVGEPT